MRILTLCYEYPPIGGGGSAVVYGLSRELARLGHEIDIVTMGYRNLPKREQIDGVNIFRLPTVRKHKSICHSHEMALHNLFALPFVLKLIKSRKYDLNHTHFIFPDGLTALLMQKLTKLPYLVTAHGSDVQGYNPDRFVKEHKLLAPLWNSIVSKATRVVCPSENLRSLIVARPKSVNTCVIPNALDPTRFCPTREKHLRVLVVTRMLKRKGVQKLLTALDGIDFPYDVNIVGDGPYLETLRQMATQVKARIKFWGWLDNHSRELKDIYETSGIFIFLSASENFPMNLLEAMASGMAIITNSETGCAEVVGDTALTINPDSVDDIRHALIKLSDDPNLRQELGSKARRRLDERFTWRIVAAQYEELYREVLQ